MKAKILFENAISLKGHELENAEIGLHYFLYRMVKNYRTFDDVKMAASDFGKVAKYYNLFVYIGGSHIALHTKYGEGIVKERLLLITEK